MKLVKFGKKSFEKYMNQVNFLGRRRHTSDAGIVMLKTTCLISSGQDQDVCIDLRRFFIKDTSSSVISYKNV